MPSYPKTPKPQNPKTPINIGIYLEGIMFCQKILQHPSLFIMPSELNFLKLSTYTTLLKICYSGLMLAYATI